MNPSPDAAPGATAPGADAPTPDFWDIHFRDYQGRRQVAPGYATQQIAEEMAAALRARYFRGVTVEPGFTSPEDGLAHAKHLAPPTLFD